MDIEDGIIAGVNSPPIPQEGLAEVLSKWVGRGNLWETVAAPMDADLSTQWTAADVRGRANRVLLEQLEQAISKWPARLSVWHDLLPAARVSAKVTKNVPFSGISWLSSRVQFGWPPRKFTGKESERNADLMIVTNLRWIVLELVNVRRQATRFFPDVDRNIRSQLDVAERLLDFEAVALATSTRPSRHELTAIRREGAPWGAVCDVAEELLNAETSFELLAKRLLIPDEQIRWRLFHLGVLGTLLSSLVRHGCSVKSLHPLSAASTTPVFCVCDQFGRKWDLWFEAGGVWSHSKVKAPYTEVTAALEGISRSLGADILLMRRDESALILECKYSSSKDMVARNGYYQATTYAAEMYSRLVKRVAAVAVGPDGVVGSSQFTRLDSGIIGIAAPLALDQIVEGFLSGALFKEPAARADSLT